MVNILIPGQLFSIRYRAVAKYQQLSRQRLQAKVAEKHEAAARLDAQMRRVLTIIRSIQL